MPSPFDFVSRVSNLGYMDDKRVVRGKELASRVWGLGSYRGLGQRVWAASTSTPQGLSSARSRRSLVYVSADFARTGTGCGRKPLRGFPARTSALPNPLPVNLAHPPSTPGEPFVPLMKEKAL